MGRFIFFNDTKRTMNLHPAVVNSDLIKCDHSPIPPLSRRIFWLDKGFYPELKVWDNDVICVFAVKEEDERRQD